MKKVLAVLALALFLGGIAAPAIAANSNALTEITFNEDDPKKKEATTSKSEATKKSSDCTATAKSSECTTTAKSSECTTTAKSKSDCTKK